MENYILISAGAISGMAEVGLTYPFDMVKTRHQLNTSSNNGVFKTLIDLYKEGGILRLYRGISAEFVGVVPKSSGMYASYEMARKFIAVDCKYGDTSRVATVAGLISGVPEAIIVTPTQVVKIRLQAKEHLGKYNGSLDCVTKTLRSEGPQALLIGLEPTLWRNCVWNAVYFGLMHWTKQKLPKAASTLVDLSQTFVTGFLGAVVATCINIPFDVVKSRIQSQLSVPGQTFKYRNTLQSLALIAKEEGLMSCYKGLNAKIAKTGLGGSVAMVVFESIQIATKYKDAVFASAD